MSIFRHRPANMYPSAGISATGAIITCVQNGNLVVHFDKKDTKRRDDAARSYLNRRKPLPLAFRLWLKGIAN